ncbi:helix-turn-helix transcriptional regulator [Xanthobacter tagetidis]|uniref:helix-turn-helix transcriptional regulator n=1 Tax=Xanthobacter tagetidis TaxID=60216 RepID=UPI00160B7C3A|nr:helix-turn-helix transcriptional regulator [Xanthobacter tagetidis]MBB6308512.1 AraC-like DNA-binding protein [Xanthobacter tagetidis]
MTSDRGDSGQGGAETVPLGHGFSAAICGAAAAGAPQMAAIFIEAGGGALPRRDLGDREGEAILVGAFRVTMNEAPEAPAPSGGGACVLGLHAPTHVLRDCGIDISRLTAAPVVVKDGEALRMLVAYLDLMRAGGGSASAPLAACASRHIADLLSLAVGSTPPARAPGTGRMRADRLGAIRTAIAGHAHLPGYSIEEAGQALALSPRYIQRLLHEDGTTFSELMTEQRLAMACRALADTRDSLADIAFRCGFGDLSVFYRAFKRKFGTSPGRFRRL